MQNPPTTPSQTNFRPDPVLAQLAVVLPLICARSFGKEELVYVRTRLEGISQDTLLDALEWLGDHADRVGNPIAAILERASEVLRDRRMRAQAEHASNGFPPPPDYGDSEANKPLPPEQSLAKLRELAARFEPRKREQP